MSMRETDADWAILGDDEPFFGVFSHEKFLRRNLTPDVLAEFWASGVEEIQYLRRVLITHFGDFQAGHAVDFGCGVGRLTRALAEVCDRVTGVDVSPGMLAEANRHRLPNITYTDRLSDQTFDWINSVIVFQHIPPVRGYGLFADLLGRLNPGGVVSVQFTLFKDEAFIGAVAEPIRRASWDGETLRVMDQTPHPPGAMMMYDYDLNRLMSLLTDHGVETVFLEHTDHGGCHGVRLFGRRGD
jgi:trans-aconitate methyltransferase